MKLNLVFNLEGTDELRSLVDALETVGTFQDKIRKEKELEEVEMKLKALRAESEILRTEIETRKKILKLETDRKQEDMSKSVSVSEASISRR